MIWRTESTPTFVSPTLTEVLEKEAAVVIPVNAKVEVLSISKPAEF